MRRLPVEKGRIIVAEMNSITQQPAWQALAAHHRQVKDVQLRTLFAQDTRGERFTAEAVGLYLDYSKNRVHRRDAAAAPEFG